MSPDMMYTKSFALTVAVMMIMQLLSPFTFAQETGSVAPVPDLEVCTLPRADYKDFNNFRLAYQASVVDQQPVLAQDHFQSMETILAAHCNTLASIVQVQAQDLDGQCNDIVNHLLAKNNYYITMGRSDDAIATQGLIQTVFQSQDCAPIIQPASELSIDLIEQDIATNQTIDPALQVIPYHTNVCFNAYGPSHTFKQQVASIQESTVAVSVFDTVTNYFSELGASAIDAIQQQREGTLLAYAKNLLGFRKTSLQFADYRQHILPFQTAEVVDLMDSIVGSDAITAVDAILAQYIPDIQEYMTQFTTYPLRQTFPEPRAQNIFASFVADPLTLTRDDATQTFTQTVGTRGLSVVFPALTTQVADPSDPSVMIEQLQRDELRVNILDIQGISQMVEYTDYSGPEPETRTQEEFIPTKILGEVLYAQEKVSGVDINIEYDETGDMTSLQIAWYLDPYIYTNTFTRSMTTDVAGNQIENANMDIRIFGPAGCDVQLQLEVVDTIDTSGTSSATQDLTFALNNTRVEIQTVDFDLMMQDILGYRQTVPSATSSPLTSNYWLDAKIYFKNTYMAYIYPENNSWNIGFSDPEWMPRSFVSTYRNPATIGAFANIQTIMGWLEIFRGSDGGEPLVEVKDIAGCTDTSADNYNSQAIIDDGSCSYGQPDPDPEQNPKPETGSGDNQGPTPDPETGTGDEGGSGYQEIPGCTDPTATNYNSGANVDDGFCTPPAPPAGPVLGCPLEGDNNYVPGADENLDSNWELCARN